jgi:hypothetical protein
MNNLNMNFVIDVSFDTIVYGGTKYVLNKAIDGEYFRKIKIADIAFFAIIDSVHYVFFKSLVFFNLSNSQYTYLISKYAFIMAGVSVLNLVTDRSKRILDNIINIGASAGVGVTVRMLYAKFRPMSTST